MQFIQSNNVPQLYFAEDSEQGAPQTEASGPTPQVWFLLPENAPSPPPQISVEDSWNIYTTGCYIFLDEALAAENQDAFAQAAWLYLSDPSLKAVRFAWFVNPNQTANGLQGNTIALYTPPNSSQLLTSLAASFAYQNITLNIGENCPVSINPDASFTIAQADQTNTSIYLTTDWGATTLNVIGPTLRLPLGGNLSGCLQFSAQLEQADGTSDLSHLDVGLRYYYAMPTDVNGGASDNDGDFWLTSLRYPIISSAQAVVMVYGNLDPLSADDARTYFAFNASDAGLPQEAAASPLDSNYSSTLGEQFKLIPQPAGSGPTTFARLALAQNPLSIPPGPSEPFYLVPKGDFVIQLPKAAAATNGQGSSPPASRLMGGLSGVEYIAADSGATNYLSFFNGKPAFAAGFVPGQPSRASAYTDTGQQPTTSWASVSAQAAASGSASAAAAQPVALTYYAQPDKSVLYQPDQSTSSGATDENSIQPLWYLEVPANTLPQTPAPDAAYPLLPYAGVSADDLDPFQQLEVQVISPLRRSTIVQKGGAGRARVQSGAATNGAPVYGTTPQGLLAQFSSDFTIMNQLVMAQMPEAQQFMLTAIPNSSNLYSALQTNQLFLVISDPTKIQSYFQPGNDSLSMSDPPWTFNFDPGIWPSVGKGTILIFKYYDKAITDLMADTSTWTQADNFSLASTSAAIQQIVADAISRAVTDSDFAYFAKIVQDPNWHGILILNGQVQTIPTTLQGLMGGIDQSQFFAHHIGINASAVNQKTTPISLQSSSMFGLINYEAQGPLVDDGAEYQYRVKMLKALFSNSQMTAFSSQIELRINQLFSEAASTVDANANNIVNLFGVYQQQELPDGTKYDSYLFEMGQGETVIFKLDSHVLNAVEFDKAQFITLSTPNASSKLTQARFVFWGLVDFAALKDLDLFSFGREGPTDPPSGLSFANLAINMSFDPTVPGSQTFEFDASHLSFDMANSVARPLSLFSHFPLTVSSFTQAKDGTAPTDLGYMGVQSALNQSSLVYPWYSLNFDLNLGTVGSLAGEAGFVASLTAAWAPNRSDYSVFMGLKLPGSNGGKREISIEGVLKLTFKTIALTSQVTQTEAAYILILYTIALKFLSLTFPPTGQINLVLFGNPDPSADNTSLGWYAAYAKPQSNPKGQSKPSTGQPVLALPKEV